MSTDKAMMKTLLQNFSVEMLMESYADFEQGVFKDKVDGSQGTGSRYGPGKSSGTKK